MVENFIVILDSCVLYPAPLRDLLIRLAHNNLFRAKWTNDIHKEWIRNVLKNRSDLNQEQLERTKNLMNNSTRDCLVEGYESIIPIIKLPDPNDRHILAAAIRSNADTIVTYNLKDFPKKSLHSYNIEAQHPDDFVSMLINTAAGSVCTTVRMLRKGLKKPPKNADEYLKTLEGLSLPQTVTLLREYSSLI